MQELSLSEDGKAAERIRGHAHITPLFSSRLLDAAAGNRIFCKGEHLQRVGAFKFRGALNAVSRLSPSQIAHGLVTQSSGNHAQALALVGKLHGVQVHIVMPRQAPEVKKAAVVSYGAQIHWCDTAQSDRESKLEEVMHATRACYIPPYDHPDIIAGQGTVALEMLDQIDDLDALVAPVGGGGLLSGVALAAKSLNPGLKVYGAEPEGADDAARSLQQGKRLPQVNPITIADGLRTSLGNWTWPLVRDYVDDIITVNDIAILNAMKFAWGHMKQIVEPSGAVALASVMDESFKARHADERVGLVLSGGNVSLDFFESTSNLDAHQALG